MYYIVQYFQQVHIAVSALSIRIVDVRTVGSFVQGVITPAFSTIYRRCRIR
jgi:hypothetical protein